MNETRKTIVFGAVALAMLILAVIFSPKRITPEAFLDMGEPFFPDFADPNEAITLEVMDFDSTTGRAKPFKVTFEDGKWTIPSHHDYPADAKDRLAKTAAGVIDIRKDDFRTDNASDHEACGTIDPLDETAGLVGRGQRVSIKGENDEVLADFIIGKPVEGRQGFRFVRVPGQNRVYAVRMDIDISTRFEDWIETDLLQLPRDKIEKVVLEDYSINERTLSVQRRDNLVLSLKDGTWVANNMAADRQVDSAKMETLLDTLSHLRIVGVRPKPEGLSASLKEAEGTQQISQRDLLSLQSKGFYMSRDGQLLSNEGELRVHTTEGVVYKLRFGEVVYGSGLAITAGVEDTTETGKEKAAENRYLFITAEFDPGHFTEPPRPKDKTFLKRADSLWTYEDRKNKEIQDKHDEWEKSVGNGKKISNDLNARFAAWYYVISSESFQDIRLKRSDLVVSKS